MSFELFLGLRYLKAKRKQGFISVITVISVLGVMVGVMALVVVLSVMNGFRADLMSKILGVNSHVLVFSSAGPFEDYQEVKKQIGKIEGVEACSPFIYSQVMVGDSGGVTGAILRGVDYQSVDAAINIEDMIKEGSLDSLERAPGELPSIIVGRELAKQIGAYPGHTVKVIAPEGRLTPMGRAPNTREFKVSAFFDSGMYEYDASMVYVSLNEAQDLLGLGERVTGLELRVRDVYQSDRMAERIEQALGHPFWTKDWKAMNRSLFSALKLEKMTMFVILTMIILVGALNIISTLVMVVMEKTREVAILRAMGASARSVMSVFMLQGLLVGTAGTVAGMASGLGLCHILEKYKFISLPSDVYYISTLPVRVEWPDVWFVAMAAVGISFLATIYPAWYASKLNPVEALRYE